MGRKMSFLCWERFKRALKNDIWEKKKNTIGPGKPGPMWDPYEKKKIKSRKVSKIARNATK